MDRVFIDEETGEDLIHPFDNYDFHRLSDSMTMNDAETGEPEVTDHMIVRNHLRRAPFQVFEKKIFASASFQFTEILQLTKLETFVFHLQSPPSQPQ